MAARRQRRITGDAERPGSGAAGSGAAVGSSGVGTGPVPIIRAARAGTRPARSDAGNGNVPAPSGPPGPIPDFTVTVSDARAAKAIANLPTAPAVPSPEGDQRPAEGQPSNGTRAVGWDPSLRARSSQDPDSDTSAPADGERPRRGLRRLPLVRRKGAEP